jgi:hemophore-related protein
MTMKPLRTTLLAALAGGAFLLTPAASANADPADLFDPLLNSTCSFSQIDNTLHAKYPDIAARLDGMPEQKTEVQSLFELPIEQRHGAVNGYLAQNPGLRDRAEQLVNSPAGAQASPIINDVANSCHSY